MNKTNMYHYTLLLNTVDTSITSVHFSEKYSKYSLKNRVLHYIVPQVAHPNTAHSFTKPGAMYLQIPHTVINHRLDANSLTEEHRNV